jgi:hypothetical protein
MVIITLFWDCEEMILIDAMPKGETVNSEVYIRTLTELGSLSNDSASQESKRNIASASLHTSFEEEWGSHHKICLGSVNTFTLQPRSITLKGAVLGTKFETEECVMSAVKNWLREQDKACRHLSVVGAEH